MKILVVCRGNSSRNEEYSLEIHQAFIVEQVKSLKRTGVEIDFFLIQGKGIFSYFSALPKLSKTLKAGYDLIHAHNGLCGVLANFQRKTPVITTYHGSDINNKWLRIISYFAILRSKHNIFVSERLIQKSIIKRNVEVIPCGVDTSVFNRFEKIISKRKLHLSVHKKYILFSSAFSNKIKNFSLAESAVNQLYRSDIEILELKNRTREEVALLLNSCELLLMTSYSEGSPQIIKEAMACNCPIVSTDVGDVSEIIKDTDGCYMAESNPDDLAVKIRMALKFAETNVFSDGRKRIQYLKLDSAEVAERICKVYNKVIKR